MGLVKVKIESIIESDECVSELKNFKFCEGTQELFMNVKCTIKSVCLCEGILHKLSK